MNRQELSSIQMTAATAPMVPNATMMAKIVWPTSQPPRVVTP
jgi:hypothetical protein